MKTTKISPESSKTQNSGASPKEKLDKADRILDAAYELFLERGNISIPIRDITERAGVAKGTFYLYFKDRNDLRNQLITRKSKELFQGALKALRAAEIKAFDEQVIFVINYIINDLDQNQMVLRLITKNLSYGIFNTQLQDYVNNEKSEIVQALMQAARQNRVHLRNPKVLLFMIVELASSTCFSCILESRPVSIEEYKPYLFATIKQMIRDAER